MYVVESRTLQAQATLVRRGKLAVADIPDWLGTAYHLVAARITQVGASITGPPFARYRTLDSDFTQFEVEAGFPIANPVAGEGEVEAGELPGGPAAVTMHIGPYAEMRGAFDALTEWISQHGMVPDGAPWEVYYSDPNEQPDPSMWRTEIVLPCTTIR